MQKIEYFTYVYHAILFFCSKSCQIKFYSLLDRENADLQKMHKRTKFSDN